MLANIIFTLQLIDCRFSHYENKTNSIKYPKLYNILHNIDRYVTNIIQLRHVNIDIR